MKKKMQKYLSGSNEGFSLVELIIVIAIMAILVGVVALAVIPNLERSRESKDLSTLDTACSALSVAVANAGAKAGQQGSFSLNSVSASTGGTGIGAVMDGVFEELGDCSNMKLGSGRGSGQDIICFYDTTTNTVRVYADATGASNTNSDGYILCQYAKNDQGDDQVLMVENAGGGAAAGGTP